MVLLHLKLILLRGNSTTTVREELGIKEGEEEEEDLHGDRRLVQQLWVLFFDGMRWEYTDDEQIPPLIFPFLSRKWVDWDFFLI